MNFVIDTVYEYALSIFLLGLAAFAIRYVLKRRKKFEKNEFE